MVYDRSQILRLLRYLLLYVLIVGFGMLMWWGFASLSEQRDDYRSKLTDATSQPTPTVTVIKTLPPKTLPPKTLPPKTVEVTVRVTERADRSSTRGSSDNATLACIREHESGGNYRAVSASGTYRGAYQMSVQYSPTWAERAGYDTWAGKPADKWPPAVQDAVAAHMGRSGWGHWSKHTSYSCPGF